MRTVSVQIVFAPDICSQGHLLPGTAARREGFACPYDECGREHARADCAPDVALENIMDQGRVEIEKKLREGGGPLPHVADQLLVSAYSSAVSGDLKFNFGRSGFFGDARDKDFAVPTATADTAHDAASDDLVGNHDHDVGGAPKTATSFTVASGTTFSSALHTAVAADAQDASAACDGTPSVGAQSLMSSVIGAMRSEADCKVCYAIFDDPVTTACGHTYCRLCLQRSLDIHPSCPLCRRNLSANTYFRTESSPTNERLGLILETLWPEQVQSRRDVAKEEAVAREAEAQHDVPIFVCTVSLPTMPTVLHIFEPRYRLMIQRAMQGNRIFGMVLPRETIRSVEPNGNESLPFAELGTLLRIKNVRVFPDGRSLVEATGMSRFRIVEHSLLDDYIVARVERSGGCVVL
ncbi:unnamed protein product [Parascedosporium putredinis]|uniref:Uncharacterized protein n=1 Tax=Parascedosporium putredinis TaxID=1442378 RepID=A0A9P1GXF7_9PEZI|nr:unnamed protein product [Parascedosporium putredinis]CAI7989761.1 unnamed protein product [Parascedosporium putredinis]